MKQAGRIGFAVIAGVFDTRYFPGRKEDFVISWAPFIGIAEWIRDYIDSGGKAKLDIKKALPPGIKVKRAYVAKRYGHLHSIQS